MANAGYVASPSRLAEFKAIDQRDAAIQKAIFKVLEEAQGKKLNSREIYRAIGFDPDQEENWQRVCGVSWWLTTLVNIHRIEQDFKSGDWFYFIRVPEKENDDVA